MRFRIVRVRRDLWLPAWGVLIVGAWGAMVALAALLDSVRGTSTPTCMFRAVTGLPCPTCGTTRACLRVLAGDLPGALRENPLMVCVGGAVLSLLAFRVLLARAPVLVLRPAERTAAWTLSIGAIGATWAYEILRHSA